MVNLCRLLRGLGLRFAVETSVEGGKYKFHGHAFDGVNLCYRCATSRFSLILLLPRVIIGNFSCPIASICVLVISSSYEIAPLAFTIMSIVTIPTQRSISISQIKLRYTDPLHHVSSSHPFDLAMINEKQATNLTCFAIQTLCARVVAFSREVETGLARNFAWTRAVNLLSRVGELYLVHWISHRTLPGVCIDLLESYLTILFCKE